ncbi:DUF5693 family protein [Candidatus Margulisiibacteriota bacterium]
MKKRLTITYVCCLCIAIIIIAITTINRIYVEKNNKNIMLITDYIDIVKVHQETGLSKAKIINELIKNGITGISLEENTLTNLEENAKIKIETKNHHLWITFYNAHTLFQLKKYFTDELGKQRVIQRGNNTLELVAIEDDILDKGIGFSIPYELQNKNITIIPRFYPSKTNIKNKLSVLQNYKYTIFSGIEILGYPNNIDVTAKYIKQHNIVVGLAEFFPQIGIHTLLNKIPDNVIRVHSIPADKIDEHSRSYCINRFVRAAHERGNRMLMIHMRSAKNQDSLEYNISYIQSIKNKLMKKGFTITDNIKPMHSIKIINHTTKNIVIGLLFIITSIVMLKFYLFLDWYKELSLILFFSIIHICGTVILVNTWTPIIGLLMACTIPFFIYKGIFTVIINKNDKNNISDVIKDIAIIFSFTIIGGLAIAALFSDRTFLIKINQFRGIKIAFIIPFILYSADVIYKYKKELTKDILSKITTPVRYHHAIFLGLIGFGFLVYIARSANFLLGTFPGEDALRQLLSDIFYVRPRTKEIFFGYPFMVIALYYFSNMKKTTRWFITLLILVAPITVINSFCHFHTPLVVTIMRSIVGLIFGTSIGFVAVYVYEYISLKRS